MIRLIRYAPRSREGLVLDRTCGRFLVDYLGNVLEMGLG